MITNTTVDSIIQDELCRVEDLLVFYKDVLGLKSFHNIFQVDQENIKRLYENADKRKEQLKMYFLVKRGQQ